MINRRIFFTLATSMTISGFLVICTLGQSIYRQRVEAKESKILEEFSNTELVVREYEGKIGVFKGDGEKPFRIIDFPASLLSEYDRQQLAEGVIFETEEELNKFVEDMFS